jgi:phosphohistidine phosphatase
MRLLFLRHGIAAAATGGMRDEDRPLTPEGEQSFHKTATMLARVAPKPRAILTSPRLRARQTAAIAAQAGVRKALAPYQEDDTVVLVGHESWISTITARFLGSRTHRAFDYRKGGVALIDAKDLEACKGTLRWFIPPRVFRRLG